MTHALSQEKKTPAGAASGGSGGEIFVQIYEIQRPEEAEVMIELGVDRIGSVVSSLDGWRNPEIKDAMGMRKNTPVKSSLLPLFSYPDAIYRAIDYYEPDIIHFCDSFVGNGKILADVAGRLVALHEGIRKRFPEIDIMRSIPVGQDGDAGRVPSLEAARLFEPVSDLFLPDTFLVYETDQIPGNQPESGFVGITGKTCDWNTAAKLVETSRIPVVLAGGISPENVFDAIARVRPQGIDSCTNTNATDARGKPIRFKKDPEKVRRLIESVRKAGYTDERQETKVKR